MLLQILCILTDKQKMYSKSGAIFINIINKVVAFLLDIHFGTDYDRGYIFYKESFGSEDDDERFFVLSPVTK